MAVTINGDGTISGISAGGLPDGVVDSGTLATDSVNSAELIDGAVDNSHLATGIDATKLTGAVPSASLTNVDLSKLEYNQALLAFKIASSNQLAKFQMVDQVIDEYQDATGIDAGNSTNALASGSGTAKYYEGGTGSTPTVSITGTGNTTTTDGDYTVHKFIIDGTYETDTTQDVEYLVVGGGGAGGGNNFSGGGGAGGYRTATGFSVSADTYSITVGAGGAASGGATGGDGGDSVFSSITSTGGGGGGEYAGGTGNDGASGGGGARNSAVGGSGTAGPPRQGYDGGTGHSAGGSTGGGGGSATEVGPAGLSSAEKVDDHSLAAAGASNSITGSSVTYAAGGRGSAGATGSANAAANTGNGADGGYSGSTGYSGGSGIVVIRRLTTAATTNNLTLQSVATTAESAPTTADLVILIEDNEGVATENTHIKAYVSRASSADFTDAVTLVDEGNWGTDKRILVARNIDISGTNTGTSMRYKIETLVQSAGGRETRIHATSLAWA